jgi:prevent-host-death family protein
MKHIWQLQEAKNKLSELVDEAISHGPQIITKRGKETAIVISSKEYRRMMASQKKLSEFFRSSPLAGVELDLKRETSGIRNEITL